MKTFMIILTYLGTLFILFCEMFLFLFLDKGLKSLFIHFDIGDPALADVSCIILAVSCIILAVFTFFFTVVISIITMENIEDNERW